MSFGMFARSPFDIFDQSYGCQSYDPWASELIHRPYYYKRPYSGRRYIHPMWNFQPQMMSYDDDYYPVQSTDTRRKPRAKKQHNGPKIQISSQPTKIHGKNECIEQADNKSNLMSNSLLSDVKDGKNDLQAHSTSDINFRDENDSDSEYQSAEEDFIPNENNQACTEQLEENQPEVIQPDVKKTEASDTDNEDHGNKDDDDVSQENHRKVSLDDVVQKRLGQIKEQVEKAHEIATDPTYSLPNKTEKQKLYLTEMLLRCILNLDMIETHGYEHVRQKRKEAILDVQKLLDQVEGS